MNLIKKYAGTGILRRVRQKVLPNLHHLTKSRIRRCRACGQVTIFLQFSRDEEARLCVRCSANLRYELMASFLKTMPLSRMDVLELDFGTPLCEILSDARSHTQTYFRGAHAKGNVRPDGARMEDITALTYRDNALDLIISSDVLEHVPDLELAGKETLRVLRPGGMHVFTVPSEKQTIKRAEIRGGEVVHLVPDPEYHSDPLDSKGILAFWHLAEDFQERWGGNGLVFTPVRGPEGVSRRIVWAATKN